MGYFKCSKQFKSKVLLKKCHISVKVQSSEPTFFQILNRGNIGFLQKCFITSTPTATQRSRERKTNERKTTTFFYKIRCQKPKRTIFPIFFRGNIFCKQTLSTNVERRRFIFNLKPFFIFETSLRFVQTCVKRMHLHSKIDNFLTDHVLRVRKNWPMLLRITRSV